MNSKLSRREFTGLAVGSAVAALTVAHPLRASLPARTPMAPIQSVTHHEGVFGGVRVPYTASVETIDIADPDGKASARLAATSYVASKSSTQRPVLFLFNGGPIVSSAILHMGAFGPKRVAYPNNLKADPATFPLVANDYTVLDAADLVFFDPAGTGYSHVTGTTKPQAYFSVDADGRQTTQFIAAWSRKHKRVNSPKYLFGESYGTMRAAAVAQQMADLKEPVRLDGVFLMGQALNIIEWAQRPLNIISYVVSLPTLAAIAWYHGRAGHEGRTFDQFVDDARQYAGTHYLTALFQGKDIAPEEKRRVAAQLEVFSGIPAAFYLANDLKITKERFRGELLKDKGLLLGRDDARYVAPITTKGVAPDPSAIMLKPIYRHFRAYLRDTLKVTTPEAYRFSDVPKQGLEGWRWGATTPFSDWPYMSLISHAIAKNPSFRVVIGNGYYDTETTFCAAEYAIATSGWPKHLVEMHHYQGGHMAYSIESTLRDLMRDVRSFVRPA